MVRSTVKGNPMFPDTKHRQSRTPRMMVKHTLEPMSLGPNKAFL